MLDIKPSHKPIKEYYAALEEFKKAFTEALQDLAADATSIKQFAAAAQAFFSRVDRASEKLWLAARVRIRSGAKLDEQFGRLPRVLQDNLPTGIAVTGVRLRRKATAVAWPTDFAQIAA